ncbi:MAG: hypothetical protein EXR79_15895 [Myxococcales bacterium]|nr:hypothetical protein [Myxococcales bacterium]
MVRFDQPARRASAALTTWAALATLAAYAAWLGFFVADHSGALYDDTFIYFRYVASLMGGCGLRFHCADAPVEGFTSPLHLAALVVGGLVGAPLPAWAGACGAVATFGAAATAMVLAWRLTAAYGSAVGPAAALATGLLLTDHVWLLNAVTGMETALAAWAVTGVALALVHDRWVKTAIFLAWLARPEAAVFGVALLVHRPYRAPRWLAPLAAAVAAVVALRWAVFDDWLPNTARAKAGGSLAHVQLGAAYLWESARLFPVAALGLVAVAVARVALGPAAHRPAASVGLLGAALWLALVVWAGGDHFDYGRLVAPLVPAATALGVVGLAAGAARVGPSRPQRHAAWLPGAVAALFAVWSASTHRLAPTHGFANVQRWALLGLYLRQHFPNARVATVPIGALSWHSGLRVLDLVGLTQREIARGGATLPPDRLVRNWIGHEREHTAWVLAQRPDVIALTRFRDRPWLQLADARAGFWAEWLLLREVKAGRAPYDVQDAPLAPGTHGLLLVRRPPVGPGG